MDAVQPVEAKQNKGEDIIRNALNNIHNNIGGAVFERKKKQNCEQGNQKGN